ncbi:MAG TPA: response regulator transcription factor [Solirubrobacterales bacterium]|nr:response regulator transcription factor [Solirubrobacterales bacterium]
MSPHRSEWPSIVVCEPDRAILDSLCDQLTADRHEVLPAPTAADALRLCRHNQPDLMVMELVLPDVSGLDILREIRQSDGIAARFDPQLPILIVAKGKDRADRVRALDEGADDYVEKSASYEELRARIGAVLRRCRRHDVGPIRVGEIVVDTATHRVRVGDREVRLARKEFALLHMLASNPTRVFSKDELMNSVWGRPRTGGTRTLDSHISRLRRKLDPGVGRYVVNCPGIGYSLKREEEVGGGKETGVRCQRGAQVGHEGGGGVLPHRHTRGHIQGCGGADPLDLQRRGAEEGIADRLQDARGRGGRSKRLRAASGFKSHPDWRRRRLRFSSTLRPGGRPS